jgi:pimeloyl-ACP methyl ester carboxylesterase
MDQIWYDGLRATARTPSGEVSYVDGGDGPVALYVHGLMVNNAVWRPLIGKLSRTRRCIAPDLLAHGRTRVRADQDVSLSAQADMLEELCQALGLDAVDLVANDFGGAVAQMFAVRHPARLRTLTLTNCDAHDNLGPPATLRRIQPIAARGRLGKIIAGMLSDPELARADFPGCGFEDTARLSEELIAELIAPGFSDSAGHRDFERCIASIRGDELVRIESDLRTLSVPTLLVWGTEDGYFGLPWAYWLRDLFPGFTNVVEVPGGRLFLQLERPDELAAAVLAHWAAHPPNQFADTASKAPR